MVSKMTVSYGLEEPGRASVLSLQSDGFVWIGNAASYGCASYGCSGFCVGAHEGSLSRSLDVLISFPWSVCLRVRQPMIHHPSIHSYYCGPVDASRHGGTDTITNRSRFRPHHLWNGIEPHVYAFDPCRGKGVIS